VVAIGVGAHGTVESRAGLIRSEPTLPGFNNIPLGPRLRDALQLPVQVHNDANAAFIAEWQLGVGRGTREFATSPAAPATPGLLDTSDAADEL
jgi:predicted NBD/HSP70 family sugar kinase